MRTIAAMLLVALLIVGRAAGAAEEGKLSLEGLPDLPLSKTDAIAAAKRIHGDCTRILALIPRLSPAEDQWLKGELDANRDLDNLMRRPEYARHALYAHFHDCVVLSRLAAYSQTERERVIRWAQLAVRFSVARDLDYWADRDGSAELSVAVKSFAAWEYLNTYRIIDDIVIPYLLRSK